MFTVAVVILVLAALMLIGAPVTKKWSDEVNSSSSLFALPIALLVFGIFLAIVGGLMLAVAHWIH